MKLRLRREIFADNYTLGSLFADDAFFCYTCEDTDRFLETGEEKVYGKTAIPRGTFLVRNSWSPRFNKILPEVLKVPQFRGIRIHGGNTADDSLGCILVGSERVDGGVKNSSAVKNQLIDWIADCEKVDEPVTLEVV